MVEVKFIGFIAEKMGTREMKISMGQPMKLRNILKVELSQDSTIVLINQKRGTLDSFIKNEDKVILMPIVSGG